ncbi:MAG: DUF3000 domain-containing protein [Propionibacteriaceae bacterium]|nr:DUF3000 domain-containing protein [Propionibacteriaceae bacterium]
MRLQRAEPEVPESFADLIDQLWAFAWSPQVTLEPISPPRSIAPFATAAAVSVETSLEEPCKGKLILLHDPDGQAAWEGDLRCVTFVTAVIDWETLHEQDRADEIWAWLVGALERQGANFNCPSGTVTIVGSTRYDGLEPQLSQASIEIRASWTPDLDRPEDLICHLRGWQEFLLDTTGLLRMISESDGLAPLPADWPHDELTMVSSQFGQVHL